MSCINLNTVVGKLVGCIGVAREKKGGELKMCTMCFRNSGQTPLKAKQDVTKMEWSKRKKVEEELCIPASVDLYVITNIKSKEFS